MNWYMRTSYVRALRLSNSDRTHRELVIFHYRKYIFEFNFLTRCVLLLKNSSAYRAHRENFITPQITIRALLLSNSRATGEGARGKRRNARRHVIG